MGSALAAPLARAQGTTNLPILGVLNPHPRETPEQAARSPIFARLKQLGWVRGETIQIERPDGEGREDRLPAMAEELVRKRVNVIWAIGPEAAVAAARATQTIPIVFWGVAYPIEQGLVDSYARPGRNVTGVAFSTGPELAGKVLEYLKQISPSAKRLAQITTPSASTDVKGNRYVGAMPTIEAAARKLGMEHRAYDIARVEDLDRVFAAILASRAQALYVPGTTLTFRERQRFVDFAIGNRLASAFNQREFVESGGLFSYGIDTPATVLQTVTYVDRVLRGAKPADLPVEMPSKYELVINVKTAKALGISVPQSVLLRADRVIE
ncbi:MAG TPA: ABC transporter substrate-binding protein [Burkholderiales bacterium]|nr:ABC transporter substrate-binding protein [Burkholderiales bacterium]